MYANGLAWGHTGTLRGDGGNGGGGVFFLSSGLAGADFWDQNADKKTFHQRNCRAGDSSC